MFYKIYAIFIYLSPTHREIIAFEFVAELMDHSVHTYLRGGLGPLARRGAVTVHTTPYT